MASSNQASTSITIDESHPFFLHHAESPGAIIVSQSLIRGENYPTWARSMERALRIKNKFWLIDGSASLTSAMEKVPLLVQSWSRCNEIVVSWIINFVSPKIATSMVYQRAAKEVWKKFQNMFSQGNGPRVYQLQKDLASISQGELIVSDYFTNLSILWDEIQNYEPLPLCSCEKCVCHVNEKISNLHHREAIMQLLMGLNDSFSHIRGQILLMDPIPSVDKVYSLLVQDERQRSVGHSNNGPFVESTALVAKTMNFGSGSKTFKKGKERPTCSHCGLLGHTVEKCYKIHGYLPRYKTKARANQASSLDSIQDSVATPTPQHFLFTMEQCQKLLAMIGGSDSPNSPIAMANNVSSNQASTSHSTPLAGNLKHSMFSAKPVNRSTFGGIT